MENIFVNDGRIRIAVIGEGPAGMMAAITAAESGGEAIIFERNEKAGKKLRITGKGRCNVTSDSTNAEIMASIPTNPKFMFASLSRFSSADTKSFFEGRGVPLKVERGKRVFPVSDKASDIVNALTSACRENGVKTVRERVSSLIIENGAIKGIKTVRGQYECDAVIVCTGGKSYSVTGSDGDGYKFARQAGHTVTEPRASLVPIVCEGNSAQRMQGLSLKNIGFKIYNNQTGKLVYDDFGELMFTHFGITGPVVLSASAHIPDIEKGIYECAIDFKPALDTDALDKRIISDFSKYINKDFINSLSDLLPLKSIEIIAERSRIDFRKKVNSITREERLALVKTIKDFRLRLTRFRPIDEAIVTKGGVCVNEINPKTMQSKLCSGLYFAGEVIDVDGYTGGFNLQIAFSTAVSAGENAAWGN